MTKDPAVAEQVAKAALLLPLAGADLELACRLAEPGGRSEQRARNLRPFFFLAESLAEYRRGCASPALRIGLQKAVSFPGEGDTDFGREIEARAVLAMASLRFQYSVDSRLAMSNAMEYAGTKLISSPAHLFLTGCSTSHSWPTFSCAKLWLEQKELLGSQNPELWPHRSQRQYRVSYSGAAG